MTNRVIWTENGWQTGIKDRQKLIRQWSRPDGYGSRHSHSGVGLTHSKDLDVSSDMSVIELAVARRHGDVVLTMSPKQAQLLAASIWLRNSHDYTTLDTVAELLTDAANGYGSIRHPSSNAVATYAGARLQDNEAELQAFEMVEAAALLAALIAERAVFTAAEVAKSAALAAQEERATATSATASAMAETVRRQVLAVQAHANAEAGGVAAAFDAAAAAADDAMMIELEVASTAKAMQDTAIAAAAQVATETHRTANLINS